MEARLGLIEICEWSLTFLLPGAPRSRRDRRVTRRWCRPVWGGPRPAWWDCRIGLRLLISNNTYSSALCATWLVSMVGCDFTETGLILTLGLRPGLQARSTEVVTRKWVPVKNNLLLVLSIWKYFRLGFKHFQIRSISRDRPWRVLPVPVTYNLRLLNQTFFPLAVYRGGAGKIWVIWPSGIRVFSNF